MTEFQTLSTHAVGGRPMQSVEEITVKAAKPPDQGFTFWDFLDVINPLQHIPVVNTIYREVTGDEIKVPAKMIGSAIIGGPIGLATAMMDSAIQDATGKDIGAHALSVFRQDTNGQSQPNQNETKTSIGSSVGDNSGSRELIPTNTTAVDVLLEAQQEKASLTNTLPSAISTEASIAAGAASAPKGMVFMPLPGRQSDPAYKSLPSQETEQSFLPLRRSTREAPPTAVNGAAEQAYNHNLASQVQLQAQSLMPTTYSQNSDSLGSLLQATEPNKQNSDMPTADPFGAARLLSEEANPVMVPAWFDKAMMDAMGKYTAMQNVGHDSR